MHQLSQRLQTMFQRSTRRKRRLQACLASSYGPLNRLNARLSVFAGRFCLRPPKPPAHASITAAHLAFNLLTRRGRAPESAVLAYDSPQAARQVKCLCGRADGSCTAKWKNCTLWRQSQQAEITPRIQQDNRKSVKSASLLQCR